MPMTDMRAMAICDQLILVQSIENTVGGFRSLAESNGSKFSSEDIVRFLNRLHVFLALLYTLVNAYSEFRDTSPSEELDDLLSDTTNVEALRLFRNAIFH